MDTEEKGHEPSPVFRNEMPIRRLLNVKMATENQEYRYHEKNGHRRQYRAENYREEVELFRSHMQDARRPAPKASCFRHNGWQKQKRKI